MREIREGGVRLNSRIHLFLINSKCIILVVHFVMIKKKGKRNPINSTPKFGPIYPVGGIYIGIQLIQCQLYHELGQI